jgi:hypothetical protein
VCMVTLNFLVFFLFHSCLLFDARFQLISLVFFFIHTSGRGGSRGGFRNGESMEESRESGSGDRDRDREVEGRYGVLYEQRMNPFAEVISCDYFRGQMKHM